MSKLSGVSATLRIKGTDGKYYLVFFNETCDAKDFDKMKGYLKEKVKEGVKYFKDNYKLPDVSGKLNYSLDVNQND